MGDRKEFWKSKTFWFALLYGAVAVAGLFGFADYSPGNDVVEIVNIVTAVVMIILRFLSSKGITFRKVS
jgi:hypothetical protein